jgi:hypothetical protein
VSRGEVRKILELRGFYELPELRAFCKLPKLRAFYKLYESRDMLSSTE